MFAGVMSRCSTPARCIPATARASPSPSPASSPAASGVATPARLTPPASASTIDPGYRGTDASCATPLMPRSRSSTAASCRSRRSASGPSGSLRMTVPSRRNSRVTRVRALSCTTSARSGGFLPGSTPLATLRTSTHGQSHLLPYLPPVEDEGDGRRAEYPPPGLHSGRARREMVKRRDDGLRSLPASSVYAASVLRRSRPRLSQRLAAESLRRRNGLSAKDLAEAGRQIWARETTSNGFSMPSSTSFYPRILSCGTASRLSAASRRR